MSTVDLKHTSRLKEQNVRHMKACLTFQIRQHDSAIPTIVPCSNNPTRSRNRNDIIPIISPYANEAKHLRDLLRRLQQRLLVTPFEDLPEPLSSFVDTISSRTTLEIALAIDRVIQNFLVSRPTHITGIRVSEIYLFGDSDVSWQVIEWREHDGKEMIAIFQMDDDDGPPEGGCSWLMLSSPSFFPIGQRKGDPESIMTLSWNVLNMPILNTLFWATQHGLGILEMPKTAAMKLYCGNRNDSLFEEFQTLFLQF